MSGAVTDRARQFAAELERLVAGDVEIAKRLNDAHQRLTAGDERLWTGLHPEDLTSSDLERRDVRRSETLWERAATDPSPGTDPRSTLAALV